MRGKKFRGVGMTKKAAKHEAAAAAWAEFGQGIGQVSVC